MDLKQMRYFLALAQDLNFGRAAARLNMAQPPLMRHIRALEEELGVQLFIRKPKGAVLTEAGQTLLDRVPNVLLLAGRAEEETKLTGEGYLDRLDGGIFSSGSHYRMHGLMCDALVHGLGRLNAEGYLQRA